MSCGFAVRKLDHQHALRGVTKIRVSKWPASIVVIVRAPAVIKMNPFPFAGREAIEDFVLDCRLARRRWPVKYDRDPSVAAQAQPSFRISGAPSVLPPHPDPHMRIERARTVNTPPRAPRRGTRRLLCCEVKGNTLIFIDDLVPSLADMHNLKSILKPPPRPQPATESPITQRRIQREAGDGHVVLGVRPPRGQT